MDAATLMLLTCMVSGECKRDAIDPVMVTLVARHRVERIMSRDKKLDSDTAWTQVLLARQASGRYEFEAIEGLEYWKAAREMSTEAIPILSGLADLLIGPPGPRFTEYEKRCFAETRKAVKYALAIPRCADPCPQATFYCHEPDPTAPDPPSFRKMGMVEVARYGAMRLYREPREEVRHGRSGRQ